ncbi:TRAP transporter small permease subunit [Propylenella binzhouense]|uniref:TRAP transporter small permease protein n=1 Tax=Propylenella binzhouense TaxID=2555902 RepID=A0A964WS44_9HYPH|nr:TRAP transporter small permease subunit [Propylenella binzhouense]MYZ46579.1 TRAP transporter small permease [Propylenella binzhouense]
MESDSAAIDTLPAEVPVVDRVLRTVENMFAGAAAVFIFALMLLGVVQIVVRVVWNLQIPGYIDYVELMMSVIAFAAIAYAERLQAHIRMDFLPGALSGRTRAAFEMFLCAIALVAASVLVYATWFSFQRTWQLGDSTMDIRAPLWPSKLLLCVSLALLWLRVLLSMVGYGRRLAAPSIGAPSTRQS